MPRFPGQFPYPKQGNSFEQGKRHAHDQADLPRGLYLYSPNGKRWLITVSNAGSITVTAA